MRIALVVVLGGDMVRSTEHVGIGLIASYLRKSGYEVSIVEITLKEGEKPLEFLSKQYDIVGFTTSCISLKYVLELAKMIKEKNRYIYTVCGGHMATFAGKQILETWKDIDFIVSGEGEVTFLQLIQALEQKTPLTEIDGISFRDNKENVVVNKQRDLIEDLNQFPFCARDQFEEHNANFQYIRISTSRGCLGSCGFCSSFVGRKHKGSKWRGRNPQNVVDEIEYLVNKYDHHTFDFVDSTFEDPGEEGKRRITEIAKEIIKRDLDIYYNCCFRAENWKEEDRDLLKVLIKSGLEKVNIGFESGNDRGLKILNKRAVMEDNWRVINLLADFPDVYITFGFIMFHPYSTREDILDNAMFLHGTGIGQVIRHYFWQLEVYPDTLMEKKLIKDNLILKNYSIDEGMYLYQFQQPEINKIVKRSKEMLKLQSVWDFEIFDIIIHTFITRLKRKYQEHPCMEQIQTFANFVIKVRAEMADYNYKFFLNLLNGDEEYNLHEESDKLNDFILRNMEKIKNEQFKLGHDLIKQGVKLVNR